MAVKLDIGFVVNSKLGKFFGRFQSTAIVVIRYFNKETGQVYRLMVFVIA